MIKKTLLIILVLLLSLVGVMADYEGNHYNAGYLEDNVNTAPVGYYANGSDIVQTNGADAYIILDASRKVLLTGTFTITGGNGQDATSSTNDGGDATLNISAEDIVIKDAIIYLTGGSGSHPSPNANSALPGGVGGSAILSLYASHTLTLDNVTITMLGGDGGNANSGFISCCTIIGANGGAGGKTYVYFYDNESNISTVSIGITNGDSGHSNIGSNGNICPGDTECELYETADAGLAGVTTLYWENIGNVTDYINNFDVTILSGDSGDNSAQCNVNAEDGEVDDSTEGLVPLNNNITFKFWNVTIINSTLTSDGTHPDDAIGCCAVNDAGSTYFNEEGQDGGSVYYTFYENFANITNFDVTLESGDGSNADAGKCSYVSSRQSNGGNAGDVIINYYGYDNSYSNEKCLGTLDVDGGTGGTADSINSGSGDGGNGGDVYAYFSDTINSPQSTFALTGGISGNDIEDGECTGGLIDIETYNSTSFNDSTFTLVAGVLGAGCLFYNTAGDIDFTSYGDLYLHDTDITSLGFTADESSSVGIITYEDFIIDDGSVLTFATDTTDATGSMIFNAFGNFEIKDSEIAAGSVNKTLALMTTTQTVFKNSDINFGYGVMGITTPRLLLEDMDFTSTGGLTTTVTISSPTVLANLSEGTLGTWSYTGSYTSTTYDDFWSNISSVQLIKVGGSASPKIYKDSNFTCEINIDIDEEATGPYYTNITFYNGTTAKYTDNEVGIPPLTTDYNYNSTIQVNGSHVGETWNCTVTLYSDFSKKSSDKEVIANRYPYNLKVYIGNSTTVSHNYDGELNSSWFFNLDRGELNNYIQSNCMTEGSCSIPIKFTSEEDSQINTSNISIYTGVASPSSTGNVNVPFNTSTSQNGNINYTDLKIVYFELDNETFRIRGFYNISGTKYYVDDLYATVLLSNFTITIIPKGMNEWYVAPKSATSKNVAPMGGNPFWNVTSNSDHNFSVWLRYNESLSKTCIKNRFVSNDYTVIVNTTPQLFMDFTSLNQVKNISTYTNFSCTGGGFVELPYFMFVKRCLGCVETDDWDSFGDIQ